MVWLHFLTAAAADIVRCYYQSLSRKRVFVFTLSFQGNSFGEQGQKKRALDILRKRRKSKGLLATLFNSHTPLRRISFLQLPLIKYWIGSFLQCSSVLSGKRLILSIKVKKEQHTLFLFHPPNVFSLLCRRRKI